MTERSPREEQARLRKMEGKKKKKKKKKSNGTVK
jgi:hypothetical protein